MLGDIDAVRLALHLYRVPLTARSIRNNQLPSSVVVLLQIVSGQKEVLAEVSKELDVPEKVIFDAACFYIEQVLLEPAADLYKVLGSERNAVRGELRRNAHLLLKWLHPDRGQAAGREVFAHRVTAAWRELGAPERRMAYDAKLSSIVPSVNNSGTRRMWKPAPRRRDAGNRPSLRSLLRLGWARWSKRQ